MKQAVARISQELLAQSLHLPDGVKIVDIRFDPDTAGVWQLKLESDAFPDSDSRQLPAARVNYSRVFHTCTDQNGAAEVWSKTTATLSIE